MPSPGTSVYLRTRENLSGGWIDITVTIGISITSSISISIGILSSISISIGILSSISISIGICRTTPTPIHTHKRRVWYRSRSSTAENDNTNTDNKII